MVGRPPALQVRAAVAPLEGRGPSGGRRSSRCPCWPTRCLRSDGCSRTRSSGTASHRSRTRAGRPRAPQRRSAPPTGGGVVTPPEDALSSVRREPARVDQTQARRQPAAVGDARLERAVRPWRRRQSDRERAVEPRQRRRAGSGGTVRPGVDRPLEIVADRCSAGRRTTSASAGDAPPADTSR